MSLPAKPKLNRPELRSPKLNNPMNWLNRTSSNSAAGSAKPTRASDLGHRPSPSIELISHPGRPGMLGSGAFVVRTPNEAMKDYQHPTSPDTINGPQMMTPRSSQDEKTRHHYSQSSQQDLALGPAFATPVGEEPPSAPYSHSSYSPPLPPIPLFSENRRSRASQRGYSPTKNGSPSRHDLSGPSVLMQVHESHVFVREPEIPLSVLHPVPPQTEFTPYLMSEVPRMTTSNILVTLETCTQTYKTTLSTLTSRTSHLSGYLVSLFANAIGSEQEADDSLSVYSHASGQDERGDVDDDESIGETYRRHLQSQGLLRTALSRPSLKEPQSGSSSSNRDIHIFLDRPSDPYLDILAYLRAPPSHETLPRSAQFRHGASLETILALRDEAVYLGLSSLLRLCNEELDAPSSSRANAEEFPRPGSLQASVVDNGDSSPEHLDAVEEEELRPLDIADVSQSFIQPVSQDPDARDPSPETPQSIESPRLPRSSLRRSPDALSRRPAIASRSQSRTRAMSPVPPPKPGFF